MVAAISLLDIDVAELHLIQQMPREFAARTRKVWPFRRVAVDDILDPHLRQKSQQHENGEDDEDDGQDRMPPEIGLTPYSDEGALYKTLQYGQRSETARRHVHWRQGDRSASEAKKYLGAKDD